MIFDGLRLKANVGQMDFCDFVHGATCGLLHCAIYNVISVRVSEKLGGQMVPTLRTSEDFVSLAKALFAEAEARLVEQIEEIAGQTAAHIEAAQAAAKKILN